MKRNILVTGISRGLGVTIVEELLRSGNHVFGISRNQSSAVSSFEKEFPDQFKWLKYDLSDLENIKQNIFKNWIGLEIPIHGFANNAAIAYDDLITNLDLNRLEQMYRVNVFAPFIISKFVIRNMLYNKTAGSIVHLSSISVHTGYKGLSLYASTKGALEAFSKNTAREWGSLGIRSNCLVAGFMETEMSASLTDNQKKRIYERTSLKKETLKTSVSSTISFLLSDNANSITGQNIFVDSGTI